MSLRQVGTIPQCGISSIYINILYKIEVMVYAGKKGEGIITAWVSRLCIVKESPSTYPRLFLRGRRWTTLSVSWIYYMSCHFKLLASSLMRCMPTTCFNGKKMSCLWNYPSRTTGPNIGMFILILMYFPCWFQIWPQYLTIILICLKSFRQNGDVDSACTCQTHRET